MTIISGSVFPGDSSDDYSYRVLSQAIICMEKGGFLVLHDLDRVYGALYDVLNQVSVHSLVSCVMHFVSVIFSCAELYY